MIVIGRNVLFFDFIVFFMVRDDCDDLFDNIFDEIEWMMNDMIGGDVGFVFEIYIDMYDEGFIF